MTEKPERRLSDRTGQEWPEAQQCNSVLNRILFAKPEEVIPLREGTESLKYSALSRRKLESVLKTLVDNGVLFQQDGKYVKATEGAGTDMQAEFLSSPSIAHPLAELAGYYTESENDSYDLTKKKDLKAYVEKQLRKIIDELPEEDVPILNKFFTQITDFIVDFLLPHFPINTFNDRVPLSWELKNQLGLLVEREEKGYVLLPGMRLYFRRLFLGGGKYDESMGKIAFDILLAVTDHPSNLDEANRYFVKKREERFGA